ncbi:hypothetical protein B566_EDAN006600 [Ephemera danica]|nr:hypothetical protein B566_EDAN006600 [Ephemera danica]
MRLWLVMLLGVLIVAASVGADKKKGDKDDDDSDSSGSGSGDDSSSDNDSDDDDSGASTLYLVHGTPMALATAAVALRLLG